MSRTGTFEFFFFFVIIWFCVLNLVLDLKTKKIYRGCYKDYQLDQSGGLYVPCEATNKYCNGPCLSETKSLLKCIDRMASNFLFLNGATTQFIRNALDTGCSRYSNQRGRSLIMKQNHLYLNCV